MGISNTFQAENLFADSNLGSCVETILRNYDNVAERELQLRTSRLQLGAIIDQLETEPLSRDALEALGPGAQKISDDVNGLLLALNQPQCVSEQ